MLRVLVIERPWWNDSKHGHNGASESEPQCQIDVLLHIASNQRRYLDSSSVRQTFGRVCLLRIWKAWQCIVDQLFFGLRNPARCQRSVEPITLQEVDVSQSDPRRCPELGKSERPCRASSVTRRTQSDRNGVGSFYVPEDVYLQIALKKGSSSESGLGRRKK
jgi:hypothetical protein